MDQETIVKNDFALLKTMRDYYEALAIINRNPNPLSFYLFTSDSKKENSWIEKVPFGGGCVEQCCLAIRESSASFWWHRIQWYGRLPRKIFVRCFTHAKAMMKTATWIDPAIKYPPFTGKLKLFKWFIR
jgi:aldehyde dehydrogenase (NAD+)